MVNYSERLHSLLFDKQSDCYTSLENINNIQVYALVDSARNNEIYDYINICAPEYRCLYWGILEEKLFSVAPYLVTLNPKEEFTQWLLEHCYGDSQCMFILSSEPIDGLHEHLKQYVVADVDMDTLDYEDAVIGDHSQEHTQALFAFYDPRVFVEWQAKMNKESAHNFFNKIEKLISENPENTEELKLYSVKKEQWHKETVFLVEEAQDKEKKEGHHNG